MNDLQKYYDAEIKEDGWPDFSELTDKDKAVLRSSYGFAGWRLSIAVESLKETVKAKIKQIWNSGTLNR